MFKRDQVPKRAEIEAMIESLEGDTSLHFRSITFSIKEVCNLTNSEIESKIH